MTMDYGKFKHSRAAVRQCSEDEPSIVFLFKGEGFCMPRVYFPFHHYYYYFFIDIFFYHDYGTTSQALLHVQVDIKLLEQT